MASEIYLIDGRRERRARLRVVLSVVVVFTVLTILRSPLYGETSEPLTDNLSGVKCLIDGAQSVSMQHAASYRGSTIYFASSKSLNFFKASVSTQISSNRFLSSPHQAERQARLLARANHQLVLLGQWKQVRCPVTGKAVDPEFSSLIAGVEIQFADANALLTVNQLPCLAAQGEMIFRDKFFDQAFERTVSKEQDLP